jgi:type I restriction enzyme S subunit
MSFVHDVDELVAAHGNGLTSKADHWERVRLGEIAQVVNGFPFPSGGFNNEAGEPVLRIRDITAGSAGTYFKGVAEGAPRVEHGDIVIGMDGDFNCRLWAGEAALINQRVCKVLPNQSLYSKNLLAYALPGFLKLVNDHTSAVTVKHLSSRTIADLPLPLPPRSEQDRLASKLDELFSRIDESERALERVQQLTGRYRQSVLRAAVTGELTHEWREKNKEKLESGEALLDRILRARREAWEKAELAKMKARGVTPAGVKWAQKYEEPVRPDTIGLPELPSGWLWVSMDMLIRNFITGPFGSALHKSDYIVDGIPLVNPTNLRGGAITPDSAVTVSSETVERLARYKLELGDIVLARRGEMGRCAAVTRTEVGWMCGTGSAILRCTSGVLSEFAALALSSIHSRKFLEANCAGTTMHNLNQDAMARVPVPVAGIAEQAAALDLLRRQLASVSVLCKQCDDEERRCSALRQAVLKAAFNGDLVSQDLADEPASAMLERIADANRVHDATRKHGLKKKA